jgi:GrpB-like predicted nucleotidyltransferase (UPF0157 family)
VASMDQRPSGDAAVVISQPRTDWPRRAATLIGELRARLPLAERLEHIGSTAIPGMAAKDVLDIQVSVSDLDIAALVFDEPLAALGFARLPYNQDHVPAGRDDPPELWEKRVWTRRNHAEGDANLHVRRSGSPNERLALLFRAWFQCHPEAVPAYSRFKTLLADLGLDVGTYSDVKDPVVDLVIAVAEDWAASTSWQP